jgi:DNA-binding response OmpR family regulator
VEETEDEFITTISLTHPTTDMVAHPFATQPEFSHLTVLLVDDESVITDILATIIEPFGCQVIVAHDGDEGWNKIKTKRPHLIISDIMMPNVDGWQLFIRYKSDDSLAGIPFVFITARDSSEEKVMALEQGVEDYWVKPFLLAEVTVRIKRLLQRISQQL